MEDIEIINRIKCGDIEAYSVLVEKYHRQLLNFIYRLTGDEKSVEDIGQEVFLSVYLSLQRFDEYRGTPFSAWLFIIARNRCVSQIRERRGRTILPIDDVPDIPACRVQRRNSRGDSELRRGGCEQPTLVRSPDEASR